MQEPEGIPGLMIRWGIAGLAGAALVIAGYLFWVGSVAGSEPLGCGTGSGCGQVLTSRWSQVFGVPVTVPAGICYLLLLLLMWRFARLSPAIRPGAWRMVEGIGCLLFLAASWFIGLQFFYLRAYCPWCLAEHACGIVIAGLIWWGAPANRRDVAGAVSETYTQVPARQFPAPHRWMVGAAAATTFGLFVLAQIGGPFTPPAAGRLAGHRGTIEGWGAERQISLLQGQLALTLSEVPVLGRPDAKHWLVMLFDYCCPHCQTTHGYLREAIAQRPADLAVVLLPSPLHSKCNPHWENDEPRFAESCDLARLALAVWRLDSQKFVELDEWLFASQEPRSYAQALEFARSLVPAQSLQEALQSPQISEQIQRNVDAYRNSQAGRIPVILSPEFDAVVGRPGSRSELLGILSEELGLEFD